LACGGHDRRSLDVGVSELQHRLAAILAADAVGYSRLMSIDDQATVAALDAARAVFRTQIEAQQGRVIDMAGDSVLAVFGTATGAVNAALAIQAQLNAMAEAQTEERRMRFRIGVHLGDVIEKADGTVYGDGVNIAARLQALADIGGILVSDAIAGAVRGRLAAGLSDAGDQQVKNIAFPVRAWRVTGVGSTAPVPTARPVGGKPSIAVLPFKVLADDPRLAFLADGLAEDVIALLARVAGFELIAPSSSFAFRNREASAEAIARSLGVRYIVEGSLRAIGGSLRVSTRLIDAASARVLWSGRVEGRSEDTADLQDGIARGVMSELEPELTRAEIAHIRRLRPENVDAWGSFQQGVGATALKGWTDEALQESRTHLRRAFELDPDFAQARAAFALMSALGSNTGVLPHTPELTQEALEQAERAIALDDGSTAVLGFAGCALSDLGQGERGIETLQRALPIDPSNAQAHVAMGASLGLQGRIEDGVVCMRRGMRISPQDRRLGFWGWALGSLLLRGDEIEAALVEARASAGRDPRLHLSRILESVALLRLGREAEARVALAAARRIRRTLTLQEVARIQGRRAAENLGPLWQHGDSP
jgi:TolB-like protein/class 3 adenylate cyclase/tetratricopeptide (TPR) repeat protein